MGSLAFLIQWIYLFAGVLFLITYKVAGPTNAYWTFAATGSLVLCNQIFHRRIRDVKTPIAALMFAGGLYSAITQNPVSVFFYPLVINLALFFTFAVSLTTDETIIQKIARKRHGILDEDTKSYTRTLTKVWTVFIAFNTVVTAYTIWLQDLEIWSLYNGLISYLTIGILATGEIVFRHFYQQRRKLS